jgi:hypothetical protein
MNKQEIQKNIENVLDYWTRTLPPTLAAVVKRNVIVSGGCIASMLLKEPVKDYDLYFKDVHTALELAKYYTSKLGVNTACVIDGKVVLNEAVVSMGRHMPISSQAFSPVYLSRNAITLSGGIQLILRFCGSVEKILETFDFAHTKSYFTFDTGLRLDQEGLESLLSKELVYVGSGFPVCALFRAHKFMRRKWKLRPSELMKIVYDIAQLDVTDPLVIKEQLGGYYGQSIAKQMNIPGKLNREVFFAIAEGYAPKNPESVGNYM